MLFKGQLVYTKLCKRGRNSIMENTSFGTEGESVNRGFAPNVTERKLGAIH
jgi:hypothetical protein